MVSSIHSYILYSLAFMIEGPEVQLCRFPERQWVKIRAIKILYFHFEVQDSFVFPLSRPRYFFSAHVARGIC